MRRAADLVATRVALRGVLALLFAVVAVVCVSARAAQHEAAAPLAPAATAVSYATPVSGPVTGTEPAGDDDAAPCGKKAVTDHSAQRAEATAHAPLVPSPLQPDALAAPATARGGPASASGGPAPPPASSSPSVLRL
ncbi:MULTISPECIES: hypothetical protein [unclassified Streptomyces]|uniref:hypothetical protein n=1 Tax=unclassified Streptomyces TaxID=2593676 RepID=UPI0006913D74|nr:MULTISPECIES: hypothetical protein [unclassified Streptomyces]